MISRTNSVYEAMRVKTTNTKGTLRTNIGPQLLLSIFQS